MGKDRWLHPLRLGGVYSFHLDVLKLPICWNACVFVCAAVKCNPNPFLVAVLAASPGCGFDCASIAEMKLVRLPPCSILIYPPWGLQQCVPLPSTATSIIKSI